jgi:hypothetical protein
MAKQYEYLLVLTLQTSSINQNHKIHPILNHKITPNDIAVIENKYSSQGIPWKVTFFNEPIVTGDFTYDVRYEKRFKNLFCQERMTIVLDHKIIASAIDAEYDYFRLIISQRIDHHFEIVVLSFQEIPDE